MTTPKATAVIGGTQAKIHRHFLVVYGAPKQHVSHTYFLGIHKSVPALVDKVITYGE